MAVVKSDGFAWLVWTGQLSGEMGGNFVFALGIRQSIANDGYQRGEIGVSEDGFNDGPGLGVVYDSVEKRTGEFIGQGVIGGDIFGFPASAGAKAYVTTDSTSPC